MDTRSIGTDYENLAVKYLEEEGHFVLERNYRERYAEIDIISKEEVKDPVFGKMEFIVFTEVKYRSSEKHGNPYEAVDTGKQRKICKAALKYLYEKGLGADTPVRFDVISIVDSKINHIKNAFEYIS